MRPKPLVDCCRSPCSLSSVVAHGVCITMSPVFVVLPPGGCGRHLSGCRAGRRFIAPQHTAQPPPVKDEATKRGGPYRGRISHTKCRHRPIHPWGYHPLDFVAHRDRPHVAGNVVSDWRGRSAASRLGSGRSIDSRPRRNSVGPFPSAWGLTSRPSHTTRPHIGNATRLGHS